MSDISKIPDEISSVSSDSIKIWPYSIKELKNKKLQFEPAIFILDSNCDLDDFDEKKWFNVNFENSEFLVYKSKKELSFIDYHKIFNTCLVSNIISFDEEGSLVEEKIIRHLIEFKQKKRTQVFLEEIKKQNSKMENFKGGLEDLVEERTRHILDSKKEIEEKVTKMRSLLRFIKDLSEALTVNDVLSLIRREIKRFHHIKSPILAYSKSNLAKEIVYFQGAQPAVKSIETSWQQSLRIRVNDSQDQTYLANAFGRPFAKIVSLPLIFNELDLKNQNSSACMYFEHSMNAKEVEEFITFMGDRIQPLCIAIDRILLENELSSAAMIWANTFDGLHDPVGIFDLDFNILRSNQYFQIEIFRNFNLEVEADLKDIISVAKSKASPQSAQLNISNKIFEVHVYPIVLKDMTEATTFVLHFVDLTPALELQSQMIQNEKMAAIGHLAGHIAHELNNPLTGVRSLAQVLIKESESGSLKDDLTEVERAAERCQKIINNLLEFSSEGAESKKELTSVSGVVNKTIPLLKTAMSQYSSDIELTAENDDILIDPNLLQQVIFNIVNNACQSMEESGEITIKTFVKNNKCHLLVKDTGCGIPEKILKKIFDPFFTTKKLGQGTGLGLSMSKSVIERFGGSIRVNSKEDKGTEFTIAFPLIRS